MTTNPLPPIHAWLAESNDPAVTRALDRMQRLEDVAHIAVMPDVHLAGDICVGTALATHRLLYPAAVGGDIGCGMLAIAFDVEAAALNDPHTAGALLRRLSQSIPQMRHHRSHVLPLPDSLRHATFSHPSLTALLHSEASLQLGTLGGGNHFVEFQSCPAGQLWLMIHTGSRALGQAVRHHHVAIALSQKHAPLPSLDSSHPTGQAYLHDAALACTFAEANRRAIATLAAAAVHDLLTAHPDPSTLITCDHNHLRPEHHQSQLLHVHRKGAMPADLHLPGLIPGSMGTQSFHVSGLGHPNSLRSASHGAGRRFSRAAARQKFSATDLKHQLRHVWFDPRHTHHLREEAPHAYKDIRSVMRAQTELVTITRTLNPLLAYKGT
jgi:tRNA-splicing ligase RtcB